MVDRGRGSSDVESSAHRTTGALMSNRHKRKQQTDWHQFAHKPTERELKERSKRWAALSFRILNMQAHVWIESVEREQRTHMHICKSYVTSLSKQADKAKFPFFPSSFFVYACVCV